MTENHASKPCNDRNGNAVTVGSWVSAPERETEVGGVSFTLHSFRGKVTNIGLSPDRDKVYVTVLTKHGYRVCEVGITAIAGKRAAWPGRLEELLSYAPKYKKSRV